MNKIRTNFLVVSSYGNDLSWIKNKTSNYLIYERGRVNEAILSGEHQKKIIFSPNLGYNLYDYFTFIVDNYDCLPDCTFFLKGNIFPRHISEEFFDRIANNKFFTPIIQTNKHNPVWPVSGFLSDTSYVEINNSWYLGSYPVKYFHSLDDFLKFCFINPIIPRYIEFAPGANYILPRENIIKFPKQFYKNLRFLISYTSLPGEAHILERALYTIWTCNYQLSDRILGNLDDLSSLPVLPFRPHNWKTQIRTWSLSLKTPNLITRLVNKLISLNKSNKIL